MTKRFSQLLTGFASVLAATMIAAQSAYANGAGMYNYGGNWGWGHMMFGSSMMVIGWGLVIFLIVLLVRRFSGGSAHGETAPSANSAEETLRKRFAVGEIDEAEFNERKRVLIS